MSTDDAARFEKACLDRTNEPMVIESTLVAASLDRFGSGDDEDQNRRGEVLIQDLMRALFDDLPTDERSRAAQAYDIQSIVLRQYINIAHVSGSIRADGAWLAIDDAGGEIARMPDTYFKRVSQAESGPTSFDVVCSDHGRLGIVTMQGGKVVGSISLGGFELSEEMKTFAIDRQSRADFEANWRELIQHFLRMSDNEFVLDITRKSLASRTDRFYSFVALATAPEDSFEALSDSLREDGLFGLEGMSTSLLRDLAAAGYVCGSPYHFGCLRGIHEWSTDGPESSIEQLNMLLKDIVGMDAIPLHDANSIQLTRL